MDKIPLISLILYSLPESIIFISLGLALYDFPIKVNLKKIILYGICHTMISYYVRAWQLSYFSVIAILLSLFICTAALTLRISLTKAIIIVSSSYLVLFLTEITIPPIIFRFTGLTFEQVIKDPFLRIVVPWVHLSLLGLLTIFLRRKKISLLPAFNLLKPKTPGTKIILWQGALLSLQAMIGVTMYITFFDKTYNNSIRYAIFEIGRLNQIIGSLLITLSIISVFIAVKLFTLADQENIITSQEVFIENVNNLFNTIRTQGTIFSIMFKS